MHELVERPYLNLHHGFSKICTNWSHRNNNGKPDVLILPVNFIAESKDKLTHLEINYSKITQ